MRIVPVILLNRGSETVYYDLYRRARYRKGKGWGVKERDVA